MSTSIAVDHGITVIEVNQHAGTVLTALRASCLCGWESPITPSRPAAGAAGAAHVASVRGPEWPNYGALATRYATCGDTSAPTRATGPVQCTSWCNYPDGHGDAAFVEDQGCIGAELRVDLTLHDPVEQSSYDTEAGEWVRGADHIEVNAVRDVGEAANIRLRRESDWRPVIEWRFTAVEAKQLVEALQLVLGQLAKEAGR